MKSCGCGYGGLDESEMDVPGEWGAGPLPPPRRPRPPPRCVRLWQCGRSVSEAEPCPAHSRCQEDAERDHKQMDA